MATKLLRALNRLALWVSGAAILLMTLAGGLDVLSTLFLNRPLPGAYEATEMLMVFTVFLALGYLHQERAYVSVDLVYNAMGALGRRIVDALVLLLMGGYFGAIAWRGWTMALKSWSIGEYSMGLVPFPLYPAKFALAIGASLAVLCCLTDLMRGGRFASDAPGRPDQQALK